VRASQGFPWLHILMLSVVIHVCVSSAGFALKGFEVL